MHGGNMDNIQNNYRITDIMQIFGIGRSTVYDLIKKNILPQPLKLGGSSIWLRSEIDDVIKELQIAREQDNTS